MPASSQDPRIVGRYAIFGQIGSGGMGAVHYGRSVDDPQAPVVAIKLLHPHLAKDPEAATMFRDEAAMARRVVHPNVVRLLEVVETDSETLHVLEYLHGEPLGRLMSKPGVHPSIPAEVAVAISVGVLEGLHAAHEARGDDGEPLELIHRDVSPQNIVVTVEGVAKVLDFGIAKARDRLAQTTREGILKGRLRYMAPELLGGRPASRQSDVYSVAVILWEMLAGRALFSGANDGEIFGKVGHETVLPPSVFTPDTPAPLEEVVLRGLSRAVERRFATAHEMAEALASTGLVAPAADVAAWVRANTSADLEARGAEVEAIRAAVASVSHAEMAPASVRRGRTGTSLLVALVVVAGVVAWELRDRVLSLARTTPSASPPSAEVPSVPVEALALTTASPPASTAAGSVPMGTVTKARSSPPHPHSPSPPASAVTHGSCYAVDSTGIWHVRPECL